MKAVLKERGILNGAGKEYDNVMISHVFYGRRDNLVIENAIIAAFKKAGGKFDDEEAEEQDTKKPEAATSGQ
ncbi:hypothetical protein ACLI1A_10380 [Flavobacterium sp. RHBU_3]|uniref:hypothetical protein n=1 Tax=Flavobacterium sp. RHBU_3 TaxID=3391184 RepID=UPI00398538E4